MPKCVKCSQYLHPDMSVVIDESNGACKCVFCYLDKNEITIEDEKTGKPDHKVTKVEAIYNYKKYVQDLKDSDRVAKVLGKHQENPFKI